jgi:hypothetical protein
LKKLKTNPPPVKMPRFSELLNNHPLVGALPENVRDPLLSNIKETVRMHGTILYKEGSRPTGIWLVSVGVVKVCNYTIFYILEAIKFRKTFLYTDFLYLPYSLLSH